MGAEAPETVTSLLWRKTMIGTEFIKGQGLGNQLFCYVTARCAAIDRNVEFATAGGELLAGNEVDKKGLYFMDLDFGHCVTEPGKYHSYQEKETRLFLANSVHDLTHGCYVAGEDSGIFSVEDETLLYGNLQAESYFARHKEEIKEWLCVKAEYDSREYTRDNLCILNLRGGEYEGNRELFLRRKYWLDAMKNMRKIRKDMEFLIVTDDVRAAGKLLPELQAIHGSLDQDYVRVKNARYLIISNSSFAFFPAYTSTTVQTVIAPKYWARHNVSDGYWASEQNIYEEFCYQDRKGRLFTAEECRRELEVYKKTSPRYQKQKKCSGRITISLIRSRETFLYYWIKGWRKLRNAKGIHMHTSL